nr:protein-methionine sulfoxide oxidase mical3b isoform X1 [Ciona intestinalis]XP_026696711.1 protein-methionine sulfoxide oxidase mical3b isoform X1 [Ciona intestinalis]|eukprot:XP_018672882.1 protein-methionine sulfoxide oxidase mical3b isoform X1 [Ciona intestinalis]
MVINKEKDTGGIDKNIKMTAEDSTKLFENFVQAQTCIQVISTFQNLCEAVALQYPPSQSSSSAQCSFYPRLKNSLSSSWRAKSLFGKLDKRYLCKEYFADQRLYKSGSRRAAEDLKVLIIGAGPCGLRTAIEMACLGAKTVVVEKRDTFSRNNVLHLWPYIITDLKTLGAKKFYGKFCAGAIDHISIRQLQLILLKIALILGVEVVFNVSFEGLCPPTQTEASQTANKGWTARVSPSNHSLRNYEFDVVVGADGKRNTLQGFKRKEFRGKLAIGLTVNFINRHTTAEAKVEEISGVAYIFNQQFFKDLQSETGIDLENIVYYKGETHYFVMTAKKHSLVSKGVLKQDYDNTNELLCYNNIDQEELMKYAKEAADFSTRHQLPHLDFAINQYGQSDIALFDFTCMYAAENAALFRETYRQKLLCCLVGDSLLEPFWPMGTGCARGFLAAFDLVWMTKQLALKRKCSNYDPNDNKVELAVLAERESIYRVLHQTTPQNTMKNHQDYTIAPSTRYANLNLKAVTPSQVKPLYISDQPINDELDIVDTEATPMVVDLVEPPNVHKSFLTRKVSMVRPSKLLSWCQKMTEGYPGVEVNDLTSSWRNGLALCAIVHRYRPDLIEWSQLTHTNIQTNNQLAFDAAEQHLGISPVMTGKEMAEKPEVDHLMMLTYISQFYEVFKNEKPSDLKSNVNAESGEVPTTPTSPSGLSSTSPFGLITRLLSKKRSLHDNQEKTGKKKKFTGPFHKKKTNSPEPEVVQNKENQSTARKDVITVGGTDVKLRPKTSTSDSKLVSDRASNRISALSNQLISQWQQNGSETRSNPKHNLTPKPSASDKCYFCDRRVYIVERLSAEGFFFHRQCFVCTHCGVTLRRGGYEFDKESGKFYCRAHYFAHSENFKMAAAKPQKQAVRKSSESDDKITPLPSDGVKLLKPIQAGSYRTPERIELENIHHFMLNDQQELSEEAVNKHNLSGTYDKSNVAADSEYMSDSSDEDIDWEAVLKEAMQDHDPSESEIDSDDDRDYDTSSRGSCLHNITTLSYLEESYLNQSVNSVCDETMADITDESEDECEEKVLKSNLSPVAEDDEQPFSNDLNDDGPEKMADYQKEQEDEIKSPEEKKSSSAESSSNGENSMATVDFGSEEEEIEINGEPHSITNGESVKPLQRTLPRSCRDSKLNLVSDNSFEDLFQSVEVESDQPNDPETPEECLFLSISEMKLHSQKFNLELTPQKCRVNYIPKKELSVISGNHSDAGHDSDGVSSTYDAVHVWLSGCLKLDSASDSEQKPATNGLKGLELDTSDFSHVSSDDEKVKKAQSLSTSSSASPLDDDTQELVTKYNQVLDEKQNDENVDTDVAKTENFKDKQGVQTLSNGDTAAGLKSVSLSSISTESLSDNADVPQSPLKPKLDQQINTATATTKPSGELENTDLCNDDENKQTADVSTHQAAMPDKKPRTVFGILSSPVSEVKDLPSGHKEEPEKIAAKNIENVKPKEAESTEEINGQHHMQRFDTLDRVENYLNKTPVGINDSITEEKFMINRSEDGLSLSDASVDEDIELSSNSSSSGSELNTAQLDVSDLIKDNSDKKSCPPDASLLKDKLGKQPVSSEQKRTFPRLPSTESIMIRASFTGKGNNTSVWSNLDNESMTSEKDVTRPTPRPRSTAFCDSSFISNYRPGPDSTLSSDETKVSAAPTERKSSFDSLELQMKLRLRARKKWFRQESLTSKQNKEHSSPSQPSVADSGISLRDKDASSPDVAEDEPPTYNSTLSNQVDVIVTEPNTPNNQSHSRSKSFDSDNDQFFTPPSRRNPQSGVMNPISPTSGRTRPPTSRQRSFLDVTDDFVSAPTTPLNPRVLPSAPSNTRRALPALPKVAHLEALSPTGSPQSPQTKKSIDEEMRAREIRVNERVAKMKESSLRNRSGSDITKTSCSSIDEADLLSIMREFRDDDVIDHHSNEPAYSGISPKPKRKSSFRHKFKRLSKKKVDSNSEDSERVRRSLPIPNLSADVVTGSSSAFDSASKSESPGKKKKTKQRKSKTKLVLPDAPGNDNSGTKKHSPGKRGLFRISPRKKEKKILPDVGDGRSTLERKYETASEREKAIVRGERFRVLPQLPTVPVRESEKSWKEIDRLL